MPGSAKEGHGVLSSASMLSVGECLVVLGSARKCQGVPRSTEQCQYVRVPKIAGICQDVQKGALECLGVSGSKKKCQGVLRSVKECE